MPKESPKPAADEAAPRHLEDRDQWEVGPVSTSEVAKAINEASPAETKVDDIIDEKPPVEAPQQAEQHLSKTEDREQSIQSVIDDQVDKIDEISET